MAGTLLVLNSGSSSLKFKVFRFDTLEPLASGEVESIGGEAAFRIARTSGQNLSKPKALPKGANHEAALDAVLRAVTAPDTGWSVTGVAHRIVHGGTLYTRPVIVTPRVIHDLTSLIPLAPLHQPHGLAAIAASDKLIADVPDVACFDTAFHAGIGEVFRTFAIEKPLRDAGVRRYGFHGLSFEWIARVLAQQHPDLARGRVVIAHLGNGASLCALHDGRSVDTTMGLTALDGLPMGTRSGSIDPGAVLYAQRALGMRPDEIEASLYQRSGLLGLSGLTNDVRVLLTSDDPAARFALDHFALKVSQFTAMMAVSMGGIDALVFTGGIGEHATPVRDAIVARLKPLGAFKVLVMTSNEETMMAVHARTLIEDNE
ncbi:MAG: acetate/propionate family kinase [Nevskiaceae bacterium]|jgi:acetate kinase|nr:acetate/propionate family kinase [Nevskiaceae bacterium]